MKAFKYEKTKLVIIVLLTLFSNTIFAQSTLEEKLQSGISKNFVLNLAKGVESDNTGLKKSCIYFAGLYEIEELVEPLIKQLQIVKESDIKILIALALYKIGDKEGIEAVEQLAKNDKSPRVKKMSSAILNKFRMDTNQTIKLSEK